MPVRFFHLSPAKPGGRQASRPHSGRRTVRNALCFFLHERRNPPSGEKGGGICQPTKRGSGGVHGGEWTNSLHLRRARCWRKSLPDCAGAAGSTAEAGSRFAKGRCRKRQWDLRIRPDTLRQRPQAWTNRSSPFRQPTGQNRLPGECVFLGSGFFGAISQRKRTCFCFFCHVAGQKKVSPAGDGGGGDSEERTEHFEPFDGARKATSDERADDSRPQGHGLVAGRRRLTLSAAVSAAGRSCSDGRARRQC